MVKKQLLATLILACLTVLLATPVAALIQNANQGPGSDGYTAGDFLFDGQHLVDQEPVIFKNGSSFIPLDLLSDRLELHTQWNNGQLVTLGKDGTKKRARVTPFMHQDTMYIPTWFISEILGYPVVEVEKANALIVFSRPLVKTNAAQESKMTQKLEEYFNKDIHQLPRDLNQIRILYAESIHPDNLDAFAANLFNAISIPTSWGSTKLVESQLVASTLDAAVMYYTIKINHQGNQRYQHGVWGFKKHNGQWMLLW